MATIITRDGKGTPLAHNEMDSNFENLNADILKLFKNSAGATEPTTTYAYMFWADTGNHILKQRDIHNTDWVEIFNMGSGMPIINDVLDLNGNKIINAQGAIEFVGDVNIVGTLTGGSCSDTQYRNENDCLANNETWTPISTGGGGSGIAEVSSDTSPQLGGGLDTDGNSILNTQGDVEVDDNLHITGDLIVDGAGGSTNISNIVTPLIINQIGGSPTNTDALLIKSSTPVTVLEGTVEVIAPCQLNISGIISCTESYAYGLAIYVDDVPQQPAGLVPFTHEDCCITVYAGTPKGAGVYISQTPYDVTTTSLAVGVHNFKVALLSADVNPENIYFGNRKANDMESLSTLNVRELSGKQGSRGAQGAQGLPGPIGMSNIGSPLNINMMGGSATSNEGLSINSATPVDVLVGDIEVLNPCQLSISGIVSCTESYVLGIAIYIDDVAIGASGTDNKCHEDCAFTYYSGDNSTTQITQLSYDITTSPIAVGVHNIKIAILSKLNSTSRRMYFGNRSANDMASMSTLNVRELAGVQGIQGEKGKDGNVGSPSQSGVFTASAGQIDFDVKSNLGLNEVECIHSGYGYSWIPLVAGVPEHCTFSTPTTEIDCTNAGTDYEWLPEHSGTDAHCKYTSATDEVDCTSAGSDYVWTPVISDVPAYCYYDVDLTTGFVEVFLNGIKLLAPEDYIVSGSIVSLTAPALDGQRMQIVFWS